MVTTERGGCLPPRTPPKHVYKLRVMGEERNAMVKKMDVEALGQYVYGKGWNERAVEQGQLDLLLEFAAAKQLRQVVKELEKAMREDTAASDTISVKVEKKWSEETDREVKSRGAEMLRGFLDYTAAEYGDEDEDEKKK